MSSDISHKHHIIPFHEWKHKINPEAKRSDREFNAPDNVVWLSLEQHTECHKWLWEHFCSYEDRLAVSLLSGAITKEEGRSERARIGWLKRPRTASIETRQKQSIVHKGNQHAKGYKFTEEQRKRVSFSRLGKPRGKYKKETKPRKSRAISTNQ